ncbi:MAG: hypothetical protein GY851_14135 [bacterium]|nr:hypothetical protein [bacterium]
MIPWQAALAGYVVIVAMLMADRDSARGFSIAMLGGLMLLPQACQLELPGVIPDLDKVSVAALGVLIGTFVFHFQSVLSFRPRPLDLVLLAFLAGAVATSLDSGRGAYDGFSTALLETLKLLLPVFLARVHLNTPRAFRTFLLTLIWMSALYAPLAVWEWRMSPQLHRILYGYFQHSFFQHTRGSFYRPAVCFYHGLTLGRFFAFTAFLAAFPMRKELARWSQAGNYLFLAPLLGLLTSMSYSPYLLFALLVTLYFSTRRQSWTGYVLPALAFVWLFLMFLGMNPMAGVTDIVASFNPERAASLQYRIDALDIYRLNILERPILGWGGWGGGREIGVATDSEFLVRALRFGLLGAFLIFGWWVWTGHVALRFAVRTRGSALGRAAYGVAAVIPICVAISVIDAALDLHVLLAASGLTAVDGLARSMARRGGGATVRRVRAAGGRTAHV